MYKLIEDKPYYLGKLTDKKIIIFKKWHFELDKFFENNYVLIHKDSEHMASCVFAEYDESNTF